MSGGDQARVTVSVAVPRELAFEIFTREIDLWWRRGLKDRHFSSDRAIIAIEPHRGGRVFESLGDGGPVQELGRVLDWEPPGPRHGQTGADFRGSAQNPAGTSRPAADCRSWSAASRHSR